MRVFSHFAIVVAIVTGLGALSGIAATAGERSINGGGYIDVGYAASSTDPANHTWRSKGTSWRLDKVSVNNLTLFANKAATAESRWGFEVGFQTGYDIDNLVTSGAVESADVQKHIYNTNLSYLIPLGNGLLIKGGLIPGHMGYENFQASHNSTYTRTYGGDLAPYFNYGVITTYPNEGTWSASFLVLNAYNYLETSNGGVSIGAQGTWQPTKKLGLALNIYSGPEQDNFSIEHWLFMSEIIAEWRVGQFLLAAAFGFGSEEQDRSVSTINQDWSWGAVWARWDPNDRWGFAVRPEFYNDHDGGITGARQEIFAVTAGAEFRISPLEMNTMSARLEYRFDRSEGPDGGFYEGSSNTLTPDQHLLIAAILWRFDTGS